jgi:hypothetical protein
MKRIVIAGACLAAALIGLLLWTIRTRKAPAAETTAPAASLQVVPPADPLPQSLEDIVARYRKTIVLLEEDESLPDADRERASLVGKIIFQENHQAISILSDDLTS